MRVLLVQPPTHSSMGLQAFMLPEPLGLEKVAGSLIKEHEVKLLDIRLEPGLFGTLAAFHPDAVGVSSSFTADVYGVYKVLQIVKFFNPRIKTFAGGQHATLANEDFSGRADAVVLGEGEITTPHLLNSWESGKSLNDVEGLAFNNTGAWVQTQPRSITHSIEEIVPARNLTAKYSPHYFMGDRQPCASIEVSRGCPYRCKFCAVWKYYQGSYRSRAPVAVFNELTQIESKYVFFTDDNALAQPLWIKELLQMVRMSGLKKRYMAQMRADSIIKHRDLLTDWQSLGLEAVFVGFETINQHGLDELNKRLTIESIDKATGILRDLKLWLMGSFIVNPDFSAEDFAELRQFVGRMKLSTPVFSILTPLPGTVLAEEKKSEIYDLLHSVLPTRLELKRFYSEFMRLNLSYFTSVNPLQMLKNPSLHKMFRLFKGFWLILKLFKENRPSGVASHHDLKPGELTNKHFPRQASSK
jgi:hopanoid C-3 methylase